MGGARSRPQGEEVPELGPYARWEELPPLPVATPVHHHHHHHHHRQRQQHQQHQQHQGGGDEAQHAAASDSGGAARGGGGDEWSVCWAQFAQPADDPALERQLLRQVHRPRPARGWTAAAQSVCTFPPPTHAERMGDCFEAVLYAEDCASVVLTHGRGFGMAPYVAAGRTARTVTKSLRQQLGRIATVRDAGRALETAFGEAHESIIKGYPEVWEAGTCTVGAGVLLPVAGLDEGLRRKLLAMEEHAHQRQYRRLQHYPDSDALQLEPDQRKRKRKAVLHPMSPAGRRPRPEAPEEEEEDSGEEREATIGGHGREESVRMLPDDVLFLIFRSLATDLPALAAAKQTCRRWHAVASSVRMADHQYLFVCGVIGDVRAYHYSRRKNQVLEITEGASRDITDPRDAGGYLGPYSDQGKPDLRNKNYCVVPCEEGDFVFLLSNGAWRNLQPFYLRHDITAADREADYPFLAHCPHHRTWAEVQGDRLLHPWDTAVTLPLLARCLARAAADAQGGLSAEAIVRAFIDHAQQATQPVRQWIMDNPGRRLVGYDLCAGWMGEASCVCLAVGRRTSDP